MTTTSSPALEHLPSKMALLRGQHRRVKLLFTFFFLITLLRKLREHFNFGLVDPNLLESYPELTRYADLMLGWPAAGDSPENNNPKWRHGRWETADWRFWRMISKGRLILLANFQSLENKKDELQARISIQKEIQECSISVKPGWRRGHLIKQ